MSGTAKVESIEPIKRLRSSLIKFAEASNTALTDAESELTRTLLWIQTEQTGFWTSQIRKRAELVSRCEEAVRMKKLFVDAAGRRSSAVDEMKALEAAKRALVQAHEKIAACKTWTRKLEKEVQNYRGTVQRFATTLSADLPVVATKLHNAIVTLESYISLGVPTEVTSTSTDASGHSSQTAGDSIARPADETIESEADEAATDAEFVEKESE